MEFLETHAKGYEDGRKKLEELVLDFKKKSENLNEASTRFFFIDRLLFDCLGWERADVIIEEAHSGKYADYVFTSPRRILIVEAKREGQYFELPVGVNSRVYAIHTICQNNTDLRNALEQVTRYCQDRGVPFGAVCNGHQIVALNAVRTDGIAPLEGRCLVFPSLLSMLEEYLDFWNSFSKFAILSNKLSQVLLDAEDYATPPKLASIIPGYPGIKRRNVFQTDLQIVSDLVLEDIPNSKEFRRLFLTNCYSRSGALSQYSTLSKNILKARYAALFDSAFPAPVTVPAIDKEGITTELLAGSLSRRPILLIGDVGVGKTTFINHFTEIDAADLTKDAIVIYIDLGTQATLATDVRAYIINEFSRQLNQTFGIDIYSDSFVRGIYHYDLEDFRVGIYRKLKESDPQEFGKQEVLFLQTRVENNEQHLFYSMNHIVRGQKRQVIVFIDNADQREIDVQQTAFLIASGIAENTPSTVFVSLRPETFHESIKSGALSGYHPKAFTISPPRIDRVIKKRLEFALKITSGEIELDRSIRIELENLELIIRAFLQTIQSNGDLLEFLENISDGNVRLALDLVKGFFGSGHVDTEKIARIMRDSGHYLVPLHEFIRATIYGDTDHYDPSSSPVADLLDVSFADPKEHFIMPIVLAFLAKEASDSNEGFVETKLLYDHVQSQGFTPKQIDLALARASARDLVQFSARRRLTQLGSIPPSTRITTKGAYHVKKLIGNFSYIDAVVVDLPIFDEELRTKIIDVDSITERVSRAGLVISYLDNQWAKVNSGISYFKWRSISNKVLLEIAQIKRKLESQKQAP